MPIVDNFRSHKLLPTTEACFHVVFMVIIGAVALQGTAIVIPSGHALNNFGSGLTSSTFSWLDKIIFIFLVKGVRCGSCGCTILDSQILARDFEIRKLAGSLEFLAAPPSENLAAYLRISFASCSQHSFSISLDVRNHSYSHTINQYYQLLHRFT